MGEEVEFASFDLVHLVWDGGVRGVMEETKWLECFYDSVPFQLHRFFSLFIIFFASSVIWVFDSRNFFVE